jgi:hypothetical protein
MPAAEALAQHAMEQWRREEAIRRRTASSFPARTFPTGTPLGKEQAQTIASALPFPQRFDSELAERRAEAKEQEPDPFLEDAREQDLLTQAQFDAYRQGLNLFHRQAKMAATLAELRLIKKQTQKFEAGFASLSLDEYRKKQLEKARDTLWTTIETGLTKLEPEMYGLAAIASTIISAWRLLKFFKYRGEPEPIKFSTLASPPPYQFLSKNMFTGMKALLINGTDLVLKGFLLGLAIVAGLTLFILIALSVKVLQNPAGALLDPELASFAKSAGLLPAVVGK